MQIIKEFRKIIRNELGDLWEVVQREIDEYFNMIDYANITYRKNYSKLNKPENNFLNDTLNIPEIYKLLFSIKENNFNYFDGDSITKNYDHYEHGYFLRDNLLVQLKPIVQRVESFRVDNFNKILENQKKFEIKKKFVFSDFKDYGLQHYDSYIQIINGIAYHKEFYIILPNLLRCVFENLLYDIFQKILDKKHIEFFFLKSQARARDFAQLIALLNILKDKDFNPYHKNTLNQSVIEILKKIQKFGNWTVHQVLSQVDKDFADKWEQKINRVILALIVFYKKIQDITLEITDQATLDKINKTIRLDKSAKNEEQKSKILAWKVIIQENEIPIDGKAVIHSLLPDIVDGEIITINCGIENDNWNKPVEKMEYIIDEIFGVRSFYDYKFAVFSLARVSYAIYLGYLLTNQVKIRYSQYNRNFQTWDWIKELDKQGSSGSMIGLFNRKKKKINEVIIKISLSAKILDEYIKELGLNLNNKIEYITHDPSEDWLTSEYQLINLSKVFRIILTNLREKAPNLNKIHLFYAGPTAGAIVIGREINPRITPLVQLYEFDRRYIPKYQESILIGEEPY
ncbi:hypothetical protein LCGC14_1086640 [marine sediment metagenome]|uniref:SMODS-associated and fused to various effectors domain-containing protein n=1 Tax=marine sediment metagenome TaxID=412755 RepID=A0A0F9MHY7_9ZZZZ